MKKIISAALLTLAMGGAAQAQGYIGGAFGVTSAGVDCENGDRCDSTDSGFKFYGGYKFTPNVAFEAGYINFGDITFQSGFAHAAIKNTAVVAAVAVHGDFTPAFGGSARLGLASVKTKYTESVPSFGYSASDSESNVKAYFGLGLDYAFTKQLKGVLSADFTTGEIGDQKGAVRLFSIGAQYNF